MELIEWLQSFYCRCCNGDWEHTYGIKIVTLDNPGWAVDVDMAELDLEDADFKEIDIQRNNEND